MPDNPSSSSPVLDIGIIGSGIAGLSCAWLLGKRHSVTLYEKKDYFGGHCNTVEVEQHSSIIPIDTGFIVYNEQNYPNLTQLFSTLNVNTQDSEMSFSVSLDRGRFEFGTNGINAIFAQRSNLLRPEFWRILKDIRKFFSQTTKMSSLKSQSNDLTLEEFLINHNYSQSFANKFILPMAGAIWSTDPADILHQPLDNFLSFFLSHGLLSIEKNITWKTVTGGSQEYVKKIISELQQHKTLKSNITRITRNQSGVILTGSDGNSFKHDAIVVATHANNALALLEQPSKQEKQLLGAFRYIDNKAFLHSDENLMPKRKRTWSSWNFLGSDNNRVIVSYWMNLLQSINKSRNFIVTLNPEASPKEELIYRSFSYSHPYFDANSLSAQKQLWKLQGKNNTWFCGSYFGYGFHEDALQSGLAVAEDLGNIKRPWVLTNESNRIFRLPLKEMG